MAGARLNRVFLMGNLTRDPELRYTPSGTAVADLGMAINDDYVSADGARHERTCFVDVTVWGRTAELCCEYLAKGRAVLVEGRLRMDTWEASDGQKRSKLRVTADSVQFLGAPRQAAEAGTPAPGKERPPAPPGRPKPAPERPAPAPEPAEEPPPEQEGEEDIPF